MSVAGLEGFQKELKMYLANEQSIPKKLHGILTGEVRDVWIVDNEVTSGFCESCQRGTIQKSISKIPRNVKISEIEMSMHYDRSGNIKSLELNLYNENESYIISAIGFEPWYLTKKEAQRDIDEYFKA
jgi:hypothetical protein